MSITLGEIAGDAVTMALGVRYLVGTAIFGVALIAPVVIQVRARAFHPLLYWAMMIASTTAGTTLADFATRWLGIGDTGCLALLLSLVVLSMAAWKTALGTISVGRVLSD